MFLYLIFEIIAAFIGLSALIVLCIHLYQQRTIHKLVIKPGIYIPILLFVLALGAGLMANRTYPPDFAMPLFMHSHAPGGLPPSIPFHNILDFLIHKNNFKHVEDIAAPSEALTQPIAPDADGIVRIHLTAKEVISEISPGIYQNYWTYNEQVPAPFLRIREGDLVEITLTNDSTSIHHHNIDLHAVNGPGGGAEATHVAPGETKSFRFTALNPGLYVYHCAMPNVSTHNSHGQYGMIMVDPKDISIALPPVEKEFYLMQGEFYAKGDIGKRGLIQFDSQALLDGNPNYVVFNGKIEQSTRFQAHVGDRVRMYVGNGGVNLVSSFHVIGEIFDTVYPEAAIGVGSTILKNVQTTAVLPGGATIVEFTASVPGKYLIVDHALARMNKGAWAILDITGPEQPVIYTKDFTSGDHHEHPTTH